MGLLAPGPTGRRARGQVALPRGPARRRAANRRRAAARLFVADLAARRDRGSLQPLHAHAGSVEFVREPCRSWSRRGARAAAATVARRPATQARALSQRGVPQPARPGAAHAAAAQRERRREGSRRPPRRPRRHAPGAHLDAARSRQQRQPIRHEGSRAARPRLPCEHGRGRAAGADPRADLRRQLHRQRERQGHGPADVARASTAGRRLTRHRRCFRRRQRVCVVRQRDRRCAGCRDEAVRDVVRSGLRRRGRSLHVAAPPQHTAHRAASRSTRASHRREALRAGALPVAGARRVRARPRDHEHAAHRAQHGALAHSAAGDGLCRRSAAFARPRRTRRHAHRHGCNDRRAVADSEATTEPQRDVRVVDQRTSKRAIDGARAVPRRPASVPLLRPHGDGDDARERLQRVLRRSCERLRRRARDVAVPAVVVLGRRIWRRRARRRWPIAATVARRHAEGGRSVRCARRPPGRRDAARR